MTENRNSKFFRLIQVAITQNLDDLIHDLYMFQGVLINEDLEINWIDNPEVMEKVIRLLTKVDILFNCLEGKFTIINCPEDKKIEFEWFVKLFAYLESEISNWDLEDDDIIYHPSEDCKNVFQNERIELVLDISKLRFLYENVIVEFKDLKNSFEEFRYFLAEKN